MITHCKTTAAAVNIRSHKWPGTPSMGTPAKINSSRYQEVPKMAPTGLKLFAGSAPVS
ncbi:hypothetical protein B0H19DRAFT_1184299 [Mycena capillaripes]|nr:hypothetical protein B0H19DRAFT_1184299 [Mycena capillaripes]